MTNYLKLEEAAMKVSMSHWTIRRAALRGEIPFTRIGGRKAIRIAETDLEAWMAKHRHEAKS